MRLTITATGSVRNTSEFSPLRVVVASYKERVVADLRPGGGTRVPPPPLSGQGSGASRGSVDPYLEASTPKAGAPRLGLLAQPLELAAVLVGEGGGASET